MKLKAGDYLVTRTESVIQVVETDPKRGYHYRFGDGSNGWTDKGSVLTSEWVERCRLLTELEAVLWRLTGTLPVV